MCEILALPGLYMEFKRFMFHFALISLGKAWILPSLFIKDIGKLKERENSLDQATNLAGELWIPINFPSLNNWPCVTFSAKPPLPRFYFFQHLQLFLFLFLFLFSYLIFTILFLILYALLILLTRQTHNNIVLFLLSLSLSLSLSIFRFFLMSK